jgi:formate-dependent nitrite reductase membrane component NrfD
MLRVFRPTSPMSVGSWLLAATGTVTGAAVVLHGRAGLLGRVGRAVGLAGALLGGPLAGYTGVLLTNTAVPVWSAAHRTLPPLFVASSAASAGWTLALLPVGARGGRLARRVAALGTLAELLCARAVHRGVSRVPRVARPLERGASGAMWRGASALGVAALASAAAARWRLAAGLGLGAALLRRFAVFHAGKASARDPRATFHQQRARLAA